MANNGKKPGTYPVGYRKPPKHSQFPKGTSGNPKGRPKGARNVKTEVEEEMWERIVVREGGIAKKVSKLRAIIKALTAKGAQGDVRASTLLCNLMLRFEEPEASRDVGEELADEDLAILERYVDRYSKDPGDSDASKSDTDHSDGSDDQQPKKE